MMKHTITVLAIFFIIAGCETKQKSKESVMDKDRAVISTQFGDIVLEFFDITFEQ